MEGQRENVTPIRLCCEAYDRMPSLLLGGGKVCDSEHCIFLDENGTGSAGLVYNPHYCKVHNMWYCESCYTAAGIYTMARATEKPSIVKLTPVFSALE